MVSSLLVLSRLLQENFKIKHRSLIETSIELVNRGGTYVLVRNQIPDFYGCDILYYVCMDSERRYFIESRSSLSKGFPYFRVKTRQVRLEENIDV